MYRKCPLGLMVCALVVALTSTSNLRAIEQSLVLGAGWNLISLWAEPDQPVVEEVFGDLPVDRLVAVFSYDGNGGGMRVWSRYQTDLASDATFLNTLDVLRAGVGYWVLLTSGPSVQVTVNGSIVPRAQATLRRGWHLIPAETQERLNWQDLFGASVGLVGALYGYDPDDRTFSGFEDPQFSNIDANGDGAVGEIEFGWHYGVENGVLRQVEPNAAYWLYVDQETVFGPVLEVEMEDDVDAFPAAGSNTWNPDGEDTDMNGNGILDYGYTVPGARTITAILSSTRKTPSGFVCHATRRSRWSSRNRGFTWSIAAAALSLFEVESDSPGIAITPSSGQVLSSDTKVTVQLAIDLGQFSPGEHDASLTVRTNGGERTVAVKISVPPILGGYAGEVVLSGAGEESPYLGTWPLDLTFLASGANLHAERSIHFESDVALEGAVGSTFDIQGVLTVDAQDPQNAYGRRYDRVISLVGRVSESGGRAGVQLGLVGEYRETLFGLSDEPISFQGTFQLLPR